MQINRLFEMIYLLIKHERMTAAELAERFEVSKRTIYRDVDLLSSAGIPIYAMKGKGGGLSLMPEFVLDKAILSEQEREELLFALKSVEKMQPAFGSETIKRLSAFFQKDTVDWIAVDFSPWDSREESRKKFLAIKTGTLQHQFVHFTYYSAKGEKSQRTVEPMKLIFKGANWYLQAYCLQKETIRSFKVCRMENVTLLDDHFLKRDIPLPELDFPMEKENYIDFTLWFSQEAAYRVYDEFAMAKVKKNEDGSFLVRISYPISDFLYSYFLSFGNTLKILAPKEAQEVLAAKAKKIAENYLGSQ